MEDTDLNSGLDLSFSEKEERVNFKNSDSLILFSDPKRLSYGDLTSTIPVKK